MKIVGFCTFFLALLWLHLTAVHCEKRDNYISRDEVCDLLELEDLPWKASTATILNDMTALTFDSCVLQDTDSNALLGRPWARCACNSVYFSALYGWVDKKIPVHPGPRIEKFKLTYISQKQCFKALKQYETAGFVLDTLLEPLEVDIYRKPNKSDTLCTLIWDFCATGNILEVYRYACGPANKLE